MDNRNTARNTRQNNNGEKHGFECPEERDYYPYWHPTPWKDIAILVGQKSECSYFQSQSQNVLAKNYCSDPKYNNQANCTTAAATWVRRTAWGIDPPVCEVGQWTRDNHLGNSALHNQFESYASNWNWTIPNDPHLNCVLRLRYNISTADYEGWGFGGKDFVNASWNNDRSPVKENERDTYFGNIFQLALNTAQYGRTFQDRSHVFEIRARPSDIPDSAKIWNLNVRGKRGNIVQVYPAVEYDYVPERLHAALGDYIHFQWTGSDTNPANNEGQGTDKTDRSNICQTLGANHNKPDDKPKDAMFDDYALQARMCFIDQVDCNPDENNQQAVDNCKKLNAARSPYFDGGVYKLNRTGEWYYFCTRNNNFSNRSQKGYVTSDGGFPGWAIALIVISVVALAVGAVVGGIILYAKTHPKA